MVTFSYTKYFVHPYTLAIVFTLPDRIEQGKNYYLHQL